MAKKHKDKREKEAEAPQFGGFKQLAGLKELKDKLEAEKKAAEDERRKAVQAGQKPQPPPPAPRKPEPLLRSASAAEEELSFHRMMSGVTPLTADKGRVPVTTEVRAPNPRLSVAEAQARATADTAAVLDHLHHLVDDAARFEVSDDGKRVEGRRTDVPPNFMRTLRRGLMPIDARLDLHGLTAEQARERLLDFLRQTRTRGERCVLVIHGKGEHTPGAGVLRGEISAWLSQGRAREHVAAFATAIDEDGGEGAVYVALRR